MRKKKKLKSNTEEETSSKRKRHGEIATMSLIVYLFDKLSNAIYNALVDGFFGYIFTAYSSELTAYENGYFVSYFKGSSKTRRFFRKVREYLSGHFENSFILKKLNERR